jgi:hypothetical protein
MKTQQAIELAGNAAALAKLLGITPSAITQWGENVPEKRVWQMRLLKPSWFRKSKTTAEAAHG